MRNWLGYHILDRWQMTAAYATLFGAGAAGAWRIAVKVMKQQKDTR